MISWADPDLMPKAEWDREYADVIMAGTLGGHLRLSVAWSEGQGEPQGGALGRRAL